MASLVCYLFSVTRCKYGLKKHLETKHAPRGNFASNFL